MTLGEFVQILKWFADRDLCDLLEWRSNSDNDDPITFYVRCNDVFWWATADVEPVTAMDLPALTKAYEDLRVLDHERYGLELWVARKRGMRPQWSSFEIPSEVRALFMAAGPERSREDEG